MAKFLKNLDEHIEEYVLGFLLLLLTSVMFLQVMMRYVFGSSLSWAEEFSRYIFVYMTFLTIGYCIKRGSMLRVDIILNWLPKAVRSILELIIQIVTLALFSVLFYHSFRVVKIVGASNQLSPAMQVPFAAIYFSTIVGFGLAVLRSIQKVITMLKDMLGRRADVL
ncbi:MAG TPA: TRAP transporter small permease [Bacillota bacterium]|nr:TRAP transporter small permease [Bacillota bacterium]HOA15481.1 TRAP transporter small permease [Bacillota bacterium]HOG52823.1 TRAP transporter small permease [Bacillota bacterium]